MPLTIWNCVAKDGNWAITRPPIFATGYVSFATSFLYQVASTCYLEKKLISNTEIYMCAVTKVLRYTLMFSTICTKGNNFCEFLLSFREDAA